MSAPDRPVAKMRALVSNLLDRALRRQHGEPSSAEASDPDSLNERLAELALEQNNGNSHETRAFLAFQSNETSPLLSLPEELLEKIVYQVKGMPSKCDQLAVAPLSLVSRKFHRIAGPILYQQAIIQFNAIGQRLHFKKILEYGSLSTQFHGVSIPTTDRCNADAYLRTIQARPDLVAHVRLLDLKRNDYGFQERRDLGLYGYKEGAKSTFTLRDLERAVQTDTPLSYHVWSSAKNDALPLDPSMDPASETLGAILRIFTKVGKTNLRALNRSPYRTDSPWDPLLGEDTEISNAPQLLGHFTRLRSIRIFCGHTNLGSVWPLFTLSALTNIYFIGGSLTLTEYQTQQWKGIRTSSVKKITYELATPKLYDSDKSNPLHYMSAACTDLHGVMVVSGLEVQTPLWYLACLRPFSRHLHKFERLAIRDRYPRHALPTATLTSVHRNSLCPRIGEIRRSKNMKILIIHVIYLLELTPKPAAKGDDIPGVLKDVKVTGPPASTSYRVLVDLTLPSSLEVLELDIGNEAFLQDAVIAALWALLPNLRERFPVLRSLTLGWHKADSYPAIEEVLLTAALEKQGVTVKTECPLRFTR